MGALLSTGVAVWMIGWIVFLVGDGNFPEQVRTAFLLIGLQPAAAGVAAYYLAERTRTPAWAAVWAHCVGGMVGMTIVVLAVVANINVASEFGTDAIERASMSSTQELWGSLLQNLAVLAAGIGLLILSALALVSLIETRAEPEKEASVSHENG